MAIDDRHSRNSQFHQVRSRPGKIGKLHPSRGSGKIDAWRICQPWSSRRSTVMNRTIIAQFDGKVIVPEKPVKLPIGKRLRIQIESLEPANGKKTGKPRKITGAGQFNSGIPDLATNKKHMEEFGKS
jgi:hypothetical protein